MVRVFMTDSSMQRIDGPCVRRRPRRVRAKNRAVPEVSGAPE